MTSDHRVAGSSPAGCRTATRANRRAIEAIQNPECSRLKVPDARFRQFSRFQSEFGTSSLSFGSITLFLSLALVRVSLVSLPESLLTDRPLA
jgi:hypothetical protein